MAEDRVTSDKMGALGLVMLGAQNNIEIFKGDTDVKAWVRNMNKCNMQCTDKEKIQLALQRSGDPVSDAIMSRIREKVNETWEEFKNYLINKYSFPTEKRTALAVMRTLKQKQGESSQVFGDRINMEAEALLGFEDIRSVEIQEELAYIYWKGLIGEKIQKKLSRAKCKTIEDGMMLAKRIENEIHEFKTVTGQVTYGSREEERMEVDRVRKVETRTDREQRERIGTGEKFESQLRNGDAIHVGQKATSRDFVTIVRTTTEVIIGATTVEVIMVG